jgi:ABC-type Fe3+/spermidine/putrescine transport system ATPase subunit
LEITDRDFFVLLGPTGSGKTTILNIIAGLADYKGNVMFDGKPIDSVPIKNRGIGYLFQNLLLFPHMSVFENVAYSLRTRNKQEDEIKNRVNKLLKSMNISYLKDRYPKNLSGGEQQRVAIARVLAYEPNILLLDEPFNNLDLRTRKHLRLEIKQLHKELGVTSVFVTHNLIEAEELGDKVAILNDGKVQQIAAPKELFSSPINDSVSEFIGTPNIIECDYCKILGNELAEIGFAELSLIVPYEDKKIEKIAISPSDIFISKEEIPGPRLNVFKGKIDKIDNLGPIVRIRVKVARKILIAEIPRNSSYREKLKVSDDVFLKIRLKSIKVF